MLQRRGRPSLAAGDLTREVSVDRSDELGGLQRTLRGMLASLRTLVRGVRSGVDSVTTASTQTAAGEP
ncbi:HAMP domain-containing protein [Mitsuaria sp. BK037]|uniref:HAMP domain-containing protein n=1 Tax=Mitsuaria sp. BK037 TaxID=2587122 RepID=UPI0038F6FE52